MTSAGRAKGTGGGVAARAVIAAAALTATLSGCGGSAPPARGPGAADGPGRNCLDASGPTTRNSVFVVGLGHVVAPSHAPVPRNPAEAIVFRLAYGTLTEVDCDGTVRPGLATDWSVSTDGLVWTFRLRRDVRLERDGRDDVLLLDAAMVREAWRESRRRLLDAGALPWPWERVLLRDVRAVGPDRLEVATRAPEPELPALLSLPEFAVAVRDPDADPLDWPRGTRGVIVDPAPASPARDLQWAPSGGDRDVAVRRIRFRIHPGVDVRDQGGVQLRFVRDRAALAYFESREDCRLGASLCDARLHLLTRHAPVAAAVTADVRRDLAARATDVLADEPPDAASPPGLLAEEEVPADPLPASLRFLFDADDPAAGDVARRLAATFPHGPAVAEGLPAAAFAAALRRGDADAFVARIPLAPSDGLESVQIATIAPWSLGGRVVPLLDPVTVLAATPGLAGITAGRDGVPRLEHAGWIRGSRP